MATVTLFKHRRKFINVVLEDGHTVKFTNGRYYTQNPDHESMLKKLAAKSGNNVYIDSSESTIDTEAASPMDLLKKKIIEEYEAKKAGGILPDSEYPQGKLLTSSTSAPNMPVKQVKNESASSEVTKSALLDRLNKGK